MIVLCASSTHEQVSLFLPSSCREQDSLEQYQPASINFINNILPSVYVLSCQGEVLRSTSIRLNSS